jgi:hypothetical protein
LPSERYQIKPEFTLSLSHIRREMADEAEAEAENRARRSRRNSLWPFGQRAVNDPRGLPAPPGAPAIAGPTPVVSPTPTTKPPAKLGQQTYLPGAEASHVNGGNGASVSHSGNENPSAVAGPEEGRSGLKATHLGKGEAEIDPAEEIEELPRLTGGPRRR